MFDNLREGLRGALKKIVGASDINEELIDSICKDVQRSLLQSDVNVRLVISITQNLKQRALGEQPPKGLSRKDHIVTILYGELAKLLGYSGDVIKTIDKAQEGPLSNNVLLQGWQAKCSPYARHPRKWQDYCNCQASKVAHKAWLQGGSRWRRHLASWRADATEDELQQNKCRSLW